MRFATPDTPAARPSQRGGLVSPVIHLALMLLIFGSSLRAQEIPPPALSPVDTVSRNVGTVRPGDLLALVVYLHPELSGTYLIDPRGYVNIPGIGSFKVAGLAPGELHERFKKEMAPGILNPDFSVAVQIRVFVIGEVGNAGLHPVEPGTSLLQMLAIAGGPTPRADLRHTSVIRDGRKFVVDLESGLSGSPAGAVTLFSNDQVVVDRKRGVLTRENISFVLSGIGAILTLTNLVITLQRNP